MSWVAALAGIYAESAGYPLLIGLAVGGLASALVSQPLNKTVHLALLLFGVSLALLHGSQPDVIVVCHAHGRERVLGYPQYLLPSIEETIELALRLGARTNPAIRCGGGGRAGLEPGEFDRQDRHQRQPTLDRADGGRGYGDHGDGQGGVYHRAQSGRPLGHCGAAALGATLILRAPQAATAPQCPAPSSEICFRAHGAKAT